MAAYLNFTLRVEYELTNPTGDPCEACDDVPYLTAWHAVVIVSDRNETATQVYLCESCKDVIRERFDPD